MQCLRALESRPQWWTSYSNSRQNAMVICQAARIETEREELLDLHRSIVESSTKLDDGLRRAAQNAEMDSARNQVFAQSVQALQEQIVTDMEGAGSLLHRKFEAFLHEMEIGIGKISSSVASALSQAKQDTGALRKVGAIQAHRIAKLNNDRISGTRPARPMLSRKPWKRHSTMYPRAKAKRFECTSRMPSFIKSWHQPCIFRSRHS